MISKSDTENILVEYRRHLHKHPELSFQEVKTSSYIKQIFATEGVRERILVHITALQQ